MDGLLFALHEPWSWDRVLWDLMLVAIYTLVGLALFAAAYVILDKATTFSVHKELIEDHNTAVGIVMGAVFIGIAIILGSAIRG
jgi:putative membrane protein